MAVAFGSAGAGVSNAANNGLAVAQPAVVNANDLLVLGAMHKYEGTTLVTPTGYTLQKRSDGGHGASGVDAGQVANSVYTKEAVGNEDGLNITVAATIGNWNVIRGIIYRYTKDASKSWSLAVCGGSQNTPNVAWSVTGDAVLDVRVGDVVLVFVARNSDAKTASLQSLTATGMTATLTSERFESASTNGDDINHLMAEFAITAGSATSAMTFAQTLTGTATADEPTGSCVFLRLREVGFVDPSGIASAEAFGTPAVDNAFDATGIASAQAFGTASLLNTLDPTGIASLQAFGTPSIAVTVDPSSIASAGAFGTPTIEYQIDPSGIASAEAFGTPTIEVVVAVDPTAIASSEAFGTPTIESYLDPSGVASGEAFGTPSLAVAFDATGIASTEAFGTPTVEYETDPGSIASAESFGTPSIEITIGVSGVASAEAFGTPTVDVDVGSSGVASAEAFGTPTIDVAIFATGIPSAEAFGGVDLFEGNRLDPSGIVSAEAFGTPSLAIAIDVAGIVSAGAFGTPDLSASLPPAIDYLAAATPTPYSAAVRATYRAIVTLTPYRSAVAATYSADDD